MPVPVGSHAAAGGACAFKEADPRIRPPRTDTFPINHLGKQLVAGRELLHNHAGPGKHGKAAIVELLCVCCVWWKIESINHPKCGL